MGRARRLAEIQQKKEILYTLYTKDEHFSATGRSIYTTSSDSAQTTPPQSLPPTDTATTTATTTTRVKGDDRYPPGIAGEYLYALVHYPNRIYEMQHLVRWTMGLPPLPDNKHGATPHSRGATTRKFRGRWRSAQEKKSGSSGYDEKTGLHYVDGSPVSLEEEVEYLDDSFKMAPSEREVKARPDARKKWRHCKYSPHYLWSDLYPIVGCTGELRVDRSRKSHVSQSLSLPPLDQTVLSNGQHSPNTASSIRVKLPQLHTCGH